MRCLPLAILCFALISVLYTPLWISVKIILSAGLLLTAFFYLQRLPAESLHAASAIQWKISSPETQWQLRIDNAWVDAKLSDVVVWKHWLFLRFKCGNTFIPVDLPLCCHHFHSPSDWRMLRRYLNHQ